MSLCLVHDDQDCDTSDSHYDERGRSIAMRYWVAVNWTFLHLR